jgi:hypothetical protein
MYCRNNTELENLELYGVTSISGSVVVQNAASLLSLVAEQLIYVQVVQVTNVPQFLALAFPLVSWMASIEIGASAITEENMREGLGGLQSASVIYIHGCLDLLDILLFALKNITEYFRAEDNGPGMGINLGILWANNVILRNIQSITLDGMVEVNGSMEISDSLNLTEIELGDLRSVGASIYIENNPNLNAIAFPSLTSIGGSFIETNNSVLKYPGNLYNLQNVASMELAGPFPSL